MSKTLAERLLALPNRLMPGKNRTDNVRYGKHADMLYDVYPSKMPQAPIVMFWHGGGWKTGNKEMYRFMGHRLQRMGFQPIVVGYPLFPEQTFPGFIADAQLAIAHASKSYPDRKIFLMGHSAGAHTALITAMTSKHPVAGVISVAGPCTISPKYWSEVFGSSFKNHLEDPRTYIGESPKETKYLLLHGAMDITVAASDATSLNKRLNDSGYSSSLRILKLVDHITILPLLAFGPLLKTRRRIKYFVESH